MKTLLLVRHAKSVNHFAAASDFERTLNEKGLKDASEMAKRLVQKNIMIDQFLSSTAVRARTTAEVFIGRYNRKPEEILLLPELYQASLEIFKQITAQIDNQFDHAAIFAHNPGITDYASSLTQTHIVNMPTCSIFAVTAEVKSWRDFPFAEKEFLFFDSPKSA